MDKILDEFTDLNVSRQRKWQLRNPDKYKEAKSKYKQSPAGRAEQARYRLKKKEIKGLDNTTHV